jgi:hypothetical protein
VVRAEAGLGPSRCAATARPASDDEAAEAVHDHGWHGRGAALAVRLELPRCMASSGGTNCPGSARLPERPVATMRAGQDRPCPRPRVVRRRLGSTTGCRIGVLVPYLHGLPSIRMAGHLVHVWSTLHRNRAVLSHLTEVGPLRGPDWLRRRPAGCLTEPGPRWPFSRRCLIQVGPPWPFSRWRLAQSDLQRRPRQMAHPSRSAVGPRILGRRSQVDLDRIAAERNGRPRQILRFTTPSQARTTGVALTGGTDS